MNQTTLLKIFSGVGVAGLVAWLLFGVFGIQALFIDRVVNEAVPDVVLNQPHPLQEEPKPVATSTATPQPSPPVQPSKPAPTPAPKPQSPTVIARGTFQQGDSTYTIQGNATITEKNGVRTLSLTNFDVTNGPDLFVYAVKAPSAENLTVKDAVSKEQFINLGTLKGNKGNQTYTIPADLTLDSTSLITIWCRRFSRHFGSAPLSL